LNGSVDVHISDILLRFVGSVNDFKGIKGQTLIKSDTKLSGQGNSKLNVLGKFQCMLESQDKFSVQDIYVVKGLTKPLLLSIVPRNPLFCSSSMVTDLTDLLVAQHFAKCPMFEHLKHFTPFAGQFRTMILKE
jgi:hypothetical protein